MSARVEHRLSTPAATGRDVERVLTETEKQPKEPAVHPALETLEPVPVPVQPKAPITNKEKRRLERIEAEKREAEHANRVMRPLLRVLGAALFPAMLASSMLGFVGGAFSLLTPAGWVLWGTLLAFSVASGVWYVTRSR